MKQLAIILGVLVAAAPASAQEAAEDPEITRLKEETARLTAQAARDNAAAAVTTASTARLQAKVDALGLPSPEGKTTLGTNAAVIETWMLSAATADAAARAIVDDVAATAGRAAPPRRPASGSEGRNRPTIGEAAGADAAASRSTYLLLTGDEDLNLDAANNLLFETTEQSRKLAEAIPTQCKQSLPVKSGGEDGGAIPLAAVGALVGLLKSDTDISGMDIAMGDGMLVAAVGDRLTRHGRVILPSAAIAPPTTGALANAWQSLITAQTEAKSCRERFAKNKPTPWVKKKLAALDAAIAAVAALEGKVTKADERGRIPLAQAIRYDALMESEPQVLRVHVEKAGGSVVKHSNLFTALGVPAVDISGGLIVTHRLTQPRSGELVSSGVHVCRSAVTSLQAVQSGRVRRRGQAPGSNCDPLFPEGARSRLAGR
jgi:hypothetical protein